MAVGAYASYRRTIERRAAASMNGKRAKTKQNKTNATPEKDNRASVNQTPGGYKFAPLVVANQLWQANQHEHASCLTLAILALTTSYVRMNVITIHTCTQMNRERAYCRAGGVERVVARVDRFPGKVGLMILYYHVYYVELYYLLIKLYRKTRRNQYCIEMRTNNGVRTFT